LGLLPTGLLCAGILFFLPLRFTATRMQHYLFSDVLGIHAPSPLLYLAVLLLLLLTSLVLGAVGTSILRVVGSIFGPLLKVLADIVRYRGDVDYQEGVLSEVSSVISFLQKGSPVLIAGHSLGSVIALDFLKAHKETLSPFSRVDLVTGGSPIRRFFHRFFPHEYKETL
jgi:hypothetical protein